MAQELTEGSPRAGGRKLCGFGGRLESVLTLSLVQPPQVWTWVDLRVTQAELNELREVADALSAVWEVSQGCLDHLLRVIDMMLFGVEESFLSSS